MAAVATPARADTVCEWMDLAAKVETAGVAAQKLVVRTGVYDRAQTQVALAMFEALNAIDHRYESYVGMTAHDPRASQDAAAVTAAYQVLLAHFPSQKTSLDEGYANAMEGVTDSAARDAGRRLGELAAQAALKSGIVDPAVTQVPYRPRTAPGVWTATELPVFSPSYVAQKPWILSRIDQFRPAPPPALTSETYTRGFNEVKALGGKSSKARTPHQARMARYRINADMLPAMRQVTDQVGRRLVDNARLFALYGMIDDEVMLANAEAKLHYNFWRPVTAIRNADQDGNPATESDPAWEPLINTPNHPEYPCAHCTQAAATAELMKREYGNAPASGVRISSLSLPNAVVQVHPTWDKWAEEVSASRVLGGVHYRFSNEAGEKMGREIAREALRKVMRPLRK
ncbi:vanadium-dependent haloperoxidase [Sphingomonas lutea]|uniref:Vanadium-dependent haloperoxidase n=1 Tax=Sphingomonas lutea TaxID=1045317 RepID=A0A7G9SFR2_9SPHN|nr:vanadium-dependent haloperoxidase [Sphingomonas lutea]QNN66687.1 vanadium-dependent haloperoxidase [Sphingomonas lutea]